MRREEADFNTAVPVVGPNGVFSHAMAVCCDMAQLVPCGDYLVITCEKHHTVTLDRHGNVARVERYGTWQ